MVLLPCLPTKTVLSALLSTALSSQIGPPADGLRIAVPESTPTSQPWRVASFVEDAGLQGKTIFFLDFEADGTLWLAASSGLYRFDGYTWQRFTTVDGLPSDYVRCVRVTRSGELWVGTDHGAGVFDGSTFDDRGSRVSLAGPSVRRIVEEPDGTLWFCCDRWPDSTVPCGLTRFQAGQWRSFGLDDGLPSEYVSDLFLDAAGERYALTRRGLARMEGERWIRPPGLAAFRASTEYVWDMVESPGVGLVASTGLGCFFRSEGHWHFQPRSKPFLNPKLGLMRDGAVISCQAGECSRFLRWTPAGFEPATEDFPIPGASAQVVAEAPDGSVWAGGVGLLVRWARAGDRWKVHPDLPLPRLSDRSGGTWFADRERVLRLGPDGWRSWPDHQAPVVTDPEGAVWMAAEGGVGRWLDHTFESIRLPRDGPQNVQSIVFDGAGAVWACGTDGEGRVRIARYEGQRWSTPAAGQLPEGALSCVRGDPRTSGLWVLVRDRRGPHTALVFVDEDGLRRVPIPAAAARDQLPRLYVDSEREVWLYGFFGLLRRDADGHGPWMPVPGLPGGAVFSVDHVGAKLMVAHSSATGGDTGVALLSSDGTWERFPGNVWGLAGRGPDGARHYSASRGVLTLIASPGPSHMRLLELPWQTRILSVAGDPQGELWIGTPESVLHFVPDGVPPETLVEGGNGSILSEGSDLVLGVQGVGRNRPLAATVGMHFEVQLDEGPWERQGAPDAGILQVRCPTVGAHVARLRAVGGTGVPDPTPATIHFEVRPEPLQARTWFPATVITFILLASAITGYSLVSWRRWRVQARGLQERVQQHSTLLDSSERKYRALLELSQRTDVVARLAAGMAHDFNNILTVLSGQAELLAKDLEGDESCSESLSAILEQAQRAKELASQIGNLGHGQTTAAKVVGLDQVIRGTENLLLAALGPTCTLNLDLSAECARVLADPGQIGQVLLNLTLNARDAMPQGGRVSIATSLVEGHVDRPGTGNRWVQLDVSDTGDGIREGMRGQVFEPFFTTKPHGKGTGLGLAIVRMIVEGFGGSITLGTTREGGTRFRILLPCPEGDQESARRA